MATGTTDIIDVRSGPEGSAPTSSYRPDIDGLRAVSILLVVAFHAGVSLFAGGYVGVDVFFVISGFLITGLLLDEHARNGRISMLGFYARRMRRLLPLSALVLVATLVVGWVLLSPLDRETLLWDARAAALYFANWRYAGQAGAYSDTGPTDSLLVHYWSLSIEEQFYVVWPLLLLGVGFLARRGRALFRPTLGVALAVIGIASLAASILLTPGGANAYYWTHVRIWELAVGAGLALARPVLRKAAPSVAGMAGVVGMVGIVVAAVTFGQDTVFPGTAALLPVVGSALVLFAGLVPGAGVSRALAAGPLPAIGRISYGWYLWHWPAIGAAVLLVGTEESEGGTAMALAKVAAVVVSFLLAIASHRLVEEPVRRSKRLAAAPRLSVAFGIVLTLIPVGLTVMSPAEAPPIATKSPSGEATGGDLVLAMTPKQARDDGVTGMGSCHHGFTGAWVAEPCVFGDPDGERTLALLGDSHAQHWFPVFDQVAEAQGWRLLVWTKSACPIVDVPIYNYRQQRPYDECSGWRRGLFEHLRAQPGMIDLVVLGRSKGYTDIVMDGDGGRVDEQDFGAHWERGAARAYDALLEASRRVLIIEDTPWAPYDIPACLSETPEDPAACDFDAEKALDLDEVLVAAERAAAVDGVTFVDFSRDLCPTTSCPVVTEEGLIMYRDAHHMTATYNRTLAPVVLAALEPLMRSR